MVPSSHLWEYPKEEWGHPIYITICVALHPSAGISLEINGNVRCYGGLLSLQQAVTRYVNSPGEISVNSRGAAISIHIECTERYRWRQAI